jgi:hypothetical protein
MVICRLNSYEFTTRPRASQRVCKQVNNNTVFWCMLSYSRHRNPLPVWIHCRLCMVWKRKGPSAIRCHNYLFYWCSDCTFLNFQPDWKKTNTHRKSFYGFRATDSVSMFIHWMCNTWYSFVWKILHRNFLFSVW